MIVKSLALLAVTSIFASGAWASHGMMLTKTSLFPKAGKVSQKADGTKVVYYGGQVISNAKIYLILWGDKVSQTTVNAMPDFYSSLLNSDYMDNFKQYNTTGITAQDGRTGTNQTIGRGAFMETIKINPAKTSGTLDDTEIQAELEKQIAAKVIPAATDDSLFMIHFPKGLKITIHDGDTVMSSCQQFCAYHEGFKAKDGSNVFYGVMPDLDSVACSFGCGSGGSLARITVSASHEVAEAISDPFPTPGSSPAFPQAWNTVDGSEIGDLCQSNTGTLKGKAASYTVQQEWSNSANACTTQGTYTAN